MLRQNMWCTDADGVVQALSHNMRNYRNTIPWRNIQQRNTINIHPTTTSLARRHQPQWRIHTHSGTAHKMTREVSLLPPHSVSARARVASAFPPLPPVSCGVVSAYFPGWTFGAGFARTSSSRWPRNAFNVVYIGCSGCGFSIMRVCG